VVDPAGIEPTAVICTNEPYSVSGPKEREARERFPNRWQLAINEKTGRVYVNNKSGARAHVA
jgi:hypothetical protein